MRVPLKPDFFYFAMCKLIRNWSMYCAIWMFDWTLCFIQIQWARCGSRLFFFSFFFNFRRCSLLSWLALVNSIPFIWWIAIKLFAAKCQKMILLVFDSSEWRGRYTQITSHSTFTLLTNHLNFDACTVHLQYRFSLISKGISITCRLFCGQIFISHCFLLKFYRNVN